MKGISFLLFAAFFFSACSNESGLNNNDKQSVQTKELTIFFVNDQHGQLDNFAKMKYMIDKAEEKTNVIVACSGDIFSGNLVVDNYPEKGYPMIDIMNSVGFDISVLGNHEFDYGEDILKKRLEQSDFRWVCANVDMSGTGIPEPFEYTTLSVEDIKVTFLGLIETGGKQNAIIPSTHPWKVQNISFERPEQVVSKYAGIKKQENADLYIALTHLGHDGHYGALGDFELATQFPYFDMIIGGHSHHLVDTVINNIPIFQAGAYLNHLGKIEMKIAGKRIESYDFALIDLDKYPDYDIELRETIKEYDYDMAFMDDVIGVSASNHQKYQIGCFYADALREVMNVDLTFQNTGGVRAGLDEGSVTKREIYSIAPFNNGTVIFEMSVSEIKSFLQGSRSGFYYSGVQLDNLDGNILIKDSDGHILPDDRKLSVGINDYIPAVHDTYFPENRNTQSMTAAETIIYYLENIQDEVNYADCRFYFRYE